MEDQATDVATLVDSRHDEISRSSKGAPERNGDARCGQGGNSERTDAGRPFELDGLEGERVRRTLRLDSSRRTRSAVVFERGDDYDIVARFGERPGERRDPGREHAVVICHEYSHGVPSFERDLGLKKDTGTIPSVLVPSGGQFVIAKDATQAIITEVGATLRTFVDEGRAVVWGFGEEEMSTAGRGQVLAPWPNRLAEGKYSFRGRTARAPLDEPELNNAIHGLVRWLPWKITPIDSSAVSCALRLAPQPAYPWWLQLEIVYSVEAHLLTVQTTAENIGNDPAPFALGFHPYLCAGPNGLDGASLSLSARERLVLDERKLPVASEPVSGTKLAGLATGIPLRGLHLDDALTDITLDNDGRWRARFTPTGERPVVVFADTAFTHAMCFTGDSLAPVQRRAALAIEPMTAPPNALATGEGVIELAPGEAFFASWGIDTG